MTAELITQLSCNYYIMLKFFLEVIKLATTSLSEKSSSARLSSTEEKYGFTL